VRFVLGNSELRRPIETKQANCTGLYGFSFEREDPKEGEKYYLPGFKAFRETVPNPVPGALYSTNEHPVQSFIWKDFSVKPDRTYVYHMRPVRGNPKNLVREAPFKITVKTEAHNAGDALHDVFFNRGVASSQVYAVKFGNRRLGLVPERKAWMWLSRGLEEAIKEFIKGAKNAQWQIRGCFYEFHYLPVLEELHDAVERGVDVQIIYDAKENEHFEREKESGERRFVESYPKQINETAIRLCGLGRCVHPRSQNKSYISHNKFMVLMKDGKAQEVWTGSTNISEGGIFGHTNVGHRIQDPGVAKKYLEYWDKLKDDRNLQTKDLKQFCEGLQPDISLAGVGPGKVKDRIPGGITALFSPGSKTDMLAAYAHLLEACRVYSPAFLCQARRH